MITINVPKIILCHANITQDLKNHYTLITDQLRVNLIKYDQDSSTYIILIYEASKRPDKNTIDGMIEAKFHLVFRS